MENIGSNADSTTASTGESMTTTVTTNTTLDSSPIHWQNTFAATNLPTPGARENSLLSNIKTFRPMSALALPRYGTAIVSNPTTNRSKPVSAYPRQLAIVKGALHTANRRNRIAIIDLKSATLKRERLDVRR